MNLGFTGTSDLPKASEIRVARALWDLVMVHSPSRVVTGGCVGIDSFVFHWFRENLPDLPQIVVLPGDLKAVDLSVVDSAWRVVRMPSTGKGSSYRDRNEELVRQSELVGSFWTGQARSGTFMTMNIAARAGKLRPEMIWGVGLPDEEVRSRYALHQKVDLRGT